MKWRKLDAREADVFREARLEAHYAAQVVAAAAMTSLDPTPDDRHPNLGWSERNRAVVGRPLPPTGSRFGLRLDELRLLELDASDAPVHEFSLVGQTLEEAHAWLADRLTEIGAKPSDAEVVRSSYELPQHLLADGRAFAHARPDVSAALADWFANGFHALEDLARRIEEKGEVRCWPHHFDVGGLYVVETDRDGQLAKSIGFGLSPGDDTYPEPYWYVSPWPYPAPEELPRFEDDAAHWHTTGFTSAILKGRAVTALGGADAQQRRVDDFLDAAFDASRDVLRERP